MQKCLPREGNELQGLGFVWRVIGFQLAHPSADEGVGFHRRRIDYLRVGEKQAQPIDAG